MSRRLVLQFAPPTCSGMSYRYYEFRAHKRLVGRAFCRRARVQGPEDIDLPGKRGGGKWCSAPPTLPSPAQAAVPAPVPAAPGVPSGVTRGRGRSPAARRAAPWGRYLFCSSSLRISRSSDVSSRPSSAHSSSSTPARDGATTTSPKKVAIAAAPPLTPAGSAPARPGALMRGHLRVPLRLVALWPRRP